jgi:hypothetical protein
MIDDTNRGATPYCLNHPQFEKNVASWKLTPPDVKKTRISAIVTDVENSKELKNPEIARLC